MKTTDARTAKGHESGESMKREARREEEKIERRKGSELKKGAERVAERSRSSDGRGPGDKQGL